MRGLPTSRRLGNTLVNPPILDTLIPLILVVLYLIFAVVWVMQFRQRMEPALRQRIGRMLGVTIVWQQQGRNQGWVIRGTSGRGKGCILLFWEVVVNWGLGVLPLFVALLVMGLLMFAIFEK